MWNRNSHAGNRPTFLSRIDDVALFAVGWQHHCGPWVSALYTMQCSFHLLTDLYSPCFLQKWQKTFSLDVTQPGCFLALICSHGFLVTGFLMSVKKTSWEMNQNKALSNRSQCEFLQHKGKNYVSYFSFLLQSGWCICIFVQDFRKVFQKVNSVVEHFGDRAQWRQRVDPKVWPEQKPRRRH